MSKIAMMELTLDTLTEWVEEGTPGDHLVDGHVKPGLISAAEHSSERSLFVKCLRGAFLTGCAWATEQMDPGEDAAQRTVVERRDDGDEELPF